jgi:hypothetical protein
MKKRLIFMVLFTFLLIILSLDIVFGETVTSYNVKNCESFSVCDDDYYSGVEAAVKCSCYNCDSSGTCTQTCTWTVCTYGCSGGRCNSAPEPTGTTCGGYTCTGACTSTGGRDYGCKSSTECDFSDSWFCHCCSTKGCDAAGCTSRCPSICSTPSDGDTGGDTGGDEEDPCEVSTSCSGWSSCSYSGECAEVGSKSRTCTRTNADCTTSTWSESGTCHRSTHNKACTHNGVSGEGVCRDGTCRDCDDNSDYCDACRANTNSGYGSYVIPESDPNNKKCCGNKDNEHPSKLTEYWGGWACCNEATDCAINDTVCVNNLESDYSNEAMGNDAICVQGNLMSRTKILTMKLLEIAKNNNNDNHYVLFCDKEALNDKEDLENIENFCVLNLKNDNHEDTQIIIGAVFNPEHNFFESIENEDICNNVGTITNEFHQCTSNNIYYNPVAQITIYSDRTIPHVNDPSWFVSIKDLFENLIDRFFNTQLSLDPDYTYVREKNQTYRSLYINRIGTKAIRAVKEPAIKNNVEREIIIADYENFNENICNETEPETPAGKKDSYEDSKEKPKDFPKLFNVTANDVRCIGTDFNSYQLFVQSETKIEDPWISITSKLRPKP